MSAGSSVLYECLERATCLTFSKQTTDLLVDQENCSKWSTKKLNLNTYIMSVFKMYSLTLTNTIKNYLPSTEEVHLEVFLCEVSHL